MLPDIRTVANTYSEGLPNSCLLHLGLCQNARPVATSKLSPAGSVRIVSSALLLPVIVSR